jgi:DNA-binding response OmpR family regulator
MVSLRRSRTAKTDGGPAGRWGQQMVGERAASTVLVVSDDAVLGGLIAMNLRRRGFLVEHTDLALAQSDRWAPALGQPDLVILDLEAGDRASTGQLRRLVGQPWVRNVPLVLASEGPATLANRLGRTAEAVVPRPSDIGGILAAARMLVGSAAAT